MTIHEWHKEMKTRVNEYLHVLENRWDPDEHFDEEFLDREFVEWWGYEIKEYDK